VHPAGKTLLFLRVWGGPPIAASVEGMLRRSFPEFEIEAWNIASLVKRRPDIVAINGWSTLREHTRAVLTGRQRFRTAFFATTYLFRRVRRLLLDRFLPRRGEFAATFQLQSLFDASLPGVPHFVYTDQTALAYGERIGHGSPRAYRPDWIELEREIYRHATCVLTRSDDISRSLVEDYRCPPERVSCVYVGCNVPVGPASGAVERYQSKEILFVGTNWELKGGPELLEAFQRLRLSHPESRLTVIGCNPAVSVPGCEVLGVLPVGALSPYFQRASVFCLPTREEAFGVAFIEALAHRLPVVATGINAIPEFVRHGHNGLLVPVRDAAAIATALETLLSDPALCQRYGEAGYAHFRERYNWEAVGSRVRKRVLADLGGANRERCRQGFFVIASPGSQPP